MNQWLESLIDSTVQCWSCGLFDRLFQIVSDAAAIAYEKLVHVSVLIFCVLFAFFVLNAVYQNFKHNMSDPWYQKSVQKVFISGIVCLGILGAGVAVPRLITMATFEPAAQMALTYSQALIHVDSDFVSEQVTYQPTDMREDGFYRPQLRDTVIMIMKTTISQFQGYMKLGVVIMDSAFTWDALLGVGSLLKHIVLFFIGLFLTIGFFKIFFKYCWYFADVIVSMVYFAFFFPLSLVLYAFKGADSLPGWFGTLGKGVGVSQFKSLINSIITLAAAVITYTVIIVIMARFFTSPDVSSADLVSAITTGQIFDSELNMENLEAMTIMTCIVLVYVLNYIADQIPQVSKMILSAFGVQENNEFGKQLAQDMTQLAQDVVDTVKKVGTTIISDGEKDKKDAK